MKVEIFSDIVCPWCYIGERRFQRALAALPERADVDVVHRPYQLDPDAPENPLPLHDYLARRFGSVADNVTARVTEVAAEEGIEMNWDDALSVNTREAHRLMRLARLEYDDETQRTLLDSLFAAHFTHGVDVSDHAELTRLGVSAGIDEQRVRDYLSSGEGGEELEAELEDARRLGIQSVPSFVFDDRYLVQGAQPVSTFVRVLEQVHQRAAEDEAA